MVAKGLEGAGIHQENGLAQGKIVVLSKKFWIENVGSVNGHLTRLLSRELIQPGSAL